MRVLIAAGMTATVLLTCAGCSGTKMKVPSLSMFSKSKDKTDASKLTNAPAAPYSATAGTAPNVSIPSETSWSNLPVYPGTTYPQTPYPEPGVASVPAYANQGPVAGGYGAMPPSVGSGVPASPYGAYAAAGAQPPPYSPPAAPSYRATTRFALCTAGGALWRGAGWRLCATGSRRRTATGYDALWPAAPGFVLRNSPTCLMASSLMRRRPSRRTRRILTAATTRGSKRPVPRPLSRPSNRAPTRSRNACGARRFVGGCRRRLAVSPWHKPCRHG